MTRPVEAVWTPLVSKPWFALPYRARLGLGWLGLLALVFGSAFGLRLPSGSTYADRGISVLGLFVFQGGIWLSSIKRTEVPW